SIIVRIDTGCISCTACTTTCPEVFLIPAGGDGAVVRGEVRRDGISSDNQAEGSPLRPVDAALADTIREAAEGCPVEVIRLAG
ncbi:MAG: 4Fe-4S single cluster domain of Ferredoxin, partial [Planctomycetota bacterium]